MTVRPDVVIGLTITLALYAFLLLPLLRRHAAATRAGSGLFHSFAAALIAIGERRKPDFVITNDQGEYLRRWWLIPRNPIFNLYLHNIVGSDDDRALHCHPWLNASVILRGGYTEIAPINQAQAAGFDYVPGFTYLLDRRAGNVVLRTGRTRHRLVNVPGMDCWTLFITGPVYRRWGFWCRTRWVYWQKFTDARDKGRTGAGCGD